MRLESVAKFHSPKSPMMSDSPRATASDSLSGTDVMAAMGMAQSQAGFGMAAFCGKHELSQNDKQKAINYLMQGVILMSSCCCWINSITSSWYLFPQSLM
jgi:hypothetical protein